MTNEFEITKYKNAILKTVNSNSGIKGVTLVIDIMKQNVTPEFSMNNYKEALKTLINDEDIVAVDYVLPKQDKSKSIYFPKDTELRILNFVSE